MMTDKQALAWELEHRAELAPRDALDAVRTEMRLRTMMRMMQSLCAALSRPLTGQYERYRISEEYARLAREVHDAS